jgi:CRP/FNR family cyclic AMP-dependent transcriptional regulator
MSSIRESLEEYPFLDEMPPEWTGRLAGLGRRVTFHNGQRIFAENQRAERFWLISKGKVGLDIHVPGRGDVLIETLPPGSVLGWSWMFPPYRWHFGAVAGDLVHAIEFDGVEVMRTCREDPALGMDLMRRFVALTVERLQAARSRLIELYSYPGAG